VLPATLVPMKRVAAVEGLVPAGVAGICAVVPLSTIAFWPVGGEPKLQFAVLNQLLAGGGPCQTSSCAYKSDDPIKKSVRLNITERHLAHREPTKKSLEHCTNVLYIKSRRDIATFVLTVLDGCVFWRKNIGLCSKARMQPLQLYREDCRELVKMIEGSPGAARATQKDDARAILTWKWNNPRRLPVFQAVELLQEVARNENAI